MRGVCDAELNLSDDAIRLIKTADGIIGIIFYTHWLKHAQGYDSRDDFRLIANVIDHIEGVRNCYDHIGIGSDLDGFIQPIDMCSNGKMSVLSKSLIGKYGQANDEKILYRNALLVLYAGWNGIPKLRKPANKQSSK